MFGLKIKEILIETFFSFGKIDYLIVLLFLKHQLISEKLKIPSV